MKLFVPFRRATLLVPSGPTHDPACELHPRDHPFVKHKSFVFYAGARIEASQKLVDGVKRGVFSHQGMLEEDVFARVCHGLTLSRSTSPKVLAFSEAVANAACEKE